MHVTIRPATTSDGDLLTQVLVLAAFWRAAGPSGSVAEVLGDPHLAHYVAGWPRPGDVGVVARCGQQLVGAAWARLLPVSDPGYGFVDETTPELSMGVVPAWRGQGVGTRLLHALVGAAGEHGLAALSLSVERDNDARRLYERAGFGPVTQAGGSTTMLLRLPGPRL